MNSLPPLSFSFKTQVNANLSTSIFDKICSGEDVRRGSKSISPEYTFTFILSILDQLPCPPPSLFMYYHVIVIVKDFCFSQQIPFLVVPLPTIVLFREIKPHC